MCPSFKLLGQLGEFVLLMQIHHLNELAGLLCLIPIQMLVPFVLKRDRIDCWTEAVQGVNHSVIESFGPVGFLNVLFVGRLGFLSHCRGSFKLEVLA